MTTILNPDGSIDAVDRYGRPMAVPLPRVRECAATDTGGCGQPGCEDGGECLAADYFSQGVVMHSLATDPLDFNLGNRTTNARPFGLDEPMRRPRFVVEIGSMVLAAAFVAGYVAGAVSVLWWGAK